VRYAWARDVMRNTTAENVVGGRGFRFIAVRLLV
jgi:hypothetical protein